MRRSERMKVISFEKITPLKKLPLEGFEGIERFYFFPEYERGDLTIKVFHLKDKANELKEKLEKEGFIKEAIVEGGYLNIRFEDSFLIEWGEALLKSLREGFSKEKEKVGIEYPSVNPNKPWHIGHLRNALIGEALSNILKKFNHTVVRINYINDLGLQIAESIYYFLNYNEEEPKEKFDHFMGKLYIKAHKLEKEKEKEIREFLQKMEKGEVDFRKIIEKVVESQYQTSKKFGVCSDVIVFESDLTELFKKGLEIIKKNPNVYYSKEKEGCLVVNLEGNEIVLVRSDGTLTYTGKDVIFHLWKMGVLKGVKFKDSNLCNAKISSKEGEEISLDCSLLLNIIGIEQRDPQKAVIGLVKKIGYDKEIKHIPYAFVRLKEAHFSGRKGTWIGYSADELLEEAKKRVKSKEEEEKIALAGIIFAILRRSPLKEVVFDWDNVLNYEGDSGVYVLYSYVRANSILKKSGKKPTKPTSLKEERETFLELLKLEDSLIKSYYSLDPSKLANQLLEVAKKFNKFYGKARIIGSEREEELLYFLSLYKSIMEEALKIINIKPVEKM